MGIGGSPKDMKKPLISNPEPDYGPKANTKPLSTDF
jgi:hypothetical protein